MSIYTPRRRWRTVREFARAVGTRHVQSVYPYLEPAPGGWALKPVDELRYHRWHAFKWSPASDVPAMDAAAVEQWRRGR